MTDRCTTGQEIMVPFYAPKTAWDDRLEIDAKYQAHAQTCAQCTQFEIDKLKAMNAKDWEAAPDVLKKDHSLQDGRERLILKLARRLQSLVVEVEA